MARQPFEIVFLPENRRYSATGPVALYVAAAGAGVLLEQPCGSQGVCGRCRVRVTEGTVPASPADREHLEPSEITAGWRLACQLLLDGPATVEVPEIARSLAGKSFGADLPPWALESPVIDIACVSLPLPGAGRVPTIDRLAAALGRRPRSLQASPRALAELSHAAGVFRETFVALEGDELLAARPGGMRTTYGLAVDIGTTSLAAALVRLLDGSVAASASALNPQAAFGADVIARIRHATDIPGGLAALSSAVRDGLRLLVERLLLEVGCSGDDVLTAAVAGNPTMLHAWAGVAISSLGTAPYIGAWVRELACRATEVDLPIHPNASVYAFPQVLSHVGGDAVAAALACDLDVPGPCRLLLDLGTNSEVIVACGDRVVATSAAAGPAFEGVSIRHGMRASPGAIGVVAFADDGRVLLETVANEPASGICGSGLIDLVSEMRRVGLIAGSGYLRRANELDGACARAFASRLSVVDGQQAFVVGPRGEPGAERDIVLTARDIRELQLAKGSVMAAAVLACRHLGLDVRQLDEVLVAGAFGNFIRKASAVGIGLVPPIDPEHIHFVGNAAGVGARLAVLDREARERARRFAHRAEYVELATRADYQSTFLDMLPFPGL